MSLSDREEQALSRLADELKRDDPRLARKLERDGPARSRRRVVLLCVAGVVFGLGAAIVATACGSVGYAAFGVAFAVCAPIFICFWCNVRHRGPGNE